MPVVSNSLQQRSYQGQLNQRWSELIDWAKHDNPDNHEMDEMFQHSELWTG